MTRLLLIRLGSLGDVIHAIPAAAALRAACPDAQIDWLVDPRYQPLLGLVRGLDRAIGFDTRDRGAAGWGSIGGLRSTHYDTVLDLQGLLKSAVLARATGAPRRIGFARAHLREPMARVFYTETPDPGAATHVIFKNLALAGALGASTTTVAFPLDIPVTPAAAEIAAVAGEYALLNPGAAWPNKRWPPERFGALAAAIRDRFGLRVLVLWGPGEEALAAAVIAASSGAAAIAPPTSIVDLLAMARGARLMVSGDTGPLHIAAAVGTPVVALFGPTWPARNGPWAEADITLSQSDRCSCHYQRRCRLDAPCINSIGVEQVMSAVDRRIGA